MTFDISLLKPNEVCINMKLLKLFRFFHLCDPKSKTIFNLNVYQLVCYIINFMVGSIVIYGLMGYVTEEKIVIIIANDIQIMFCCILYYLCLVKTITIFHKAKNIWSLLHVSSIHFLTSKQCQNHIGILYKYREKLIKITNYISVITIVVIIQWCLYPLLLILLQKEHANQSNKRFENIFNFRFPVTISYYNNNFVIFYIIELSIGLTLAYMHLVGDIFFISLCCVMIAQYEMIQIAYKNVNSELNYENSNKHKSYVNINDCYDDLVSIMKDQQKLFEKFKLFHSTFKLIIVSNVVVYSWSIIILIYSSTLILFTSSESIPMLTIIKLLTTFGTVIVLLLLLCYLLERINNIKESVHFGMYNCNWTSMNLRSKKMLLLSMQMNNANKLMIKITPRKIIDLQFFNSVIITCYNIISAMLNITSK
ncbi:uncharacterized protein LOC132918876 [Rhopalosiphum padi]|uniref:uncharacterized protein LOC132918876 n=1 Tax=Rhopalosiphum padi TaxID=40932 RepID=UPI00298DA297|nr:uncharacterized protein LOC132918876 [Rhopalosiphum padi]